MSRIIREWPSTMIQSRGWVGASRLNPLGSSSPCPQSTTKRCLFAGRSCARIVLLSIAVRLSGRLGTSFRPKSELIGIPQAGIARHLLRETGDPQVSCRAQVVVRGRMNRSSASVLSSESDYERTPAMITGGFVCPPATPTVRVPISKTGFGRSLPATIFATFPGCGG